MKRTLFLASSSPRREQILRKFKISFTKIQNHFKEPDIFYSKNFKQNLRAIAYQKAFQSKGSHIGLVLGVDTIVTLNNRVFGKPKSVEEASLFLNTLSGNTHEVISAFCVLDTIKNSSIRRTQITQITFKKISDLEISWYCKNFSVLDKAGAYGIQDIKDRFIQKVDGSYYNAMGLPIEMLLKVLTNYDIVP